MITKILLIDMLIITILIYLLLVGADKCKTSKEIEIEDNDQMEQLKNHCRDKKNTKK